MQQTINNDRIIKTLQSLLSASDIEGARRLLDNHHPADIANFLGELSAEHAILAFGLLPDFEASEVLDETRPTLRAELIDQVDDERLADLLDTLPMDDAAELLDDLPDDISNRLLGLMEEEEAREVRKILSYGEDTAGRLMNQDLAVLRKQWTVAQALEYLRNLGETETLHYLYVTDVVGRLIGVVPIHNLVLAQADATIDSITIDEVVTVHADVDQEELSDVFAHYDYTAVPVVDKDNRLLGVVTIDDILDVLEEETTEDFQRLGGSEPLDLPYFATSVFSMVRKRIIWLMLLFVASGLSSFVLRKFEPLTSSVIVLTTFIPLVIGTGGNAGSQTVTTIIRGIAVDEIQLKDLGRAWRREVTVGLILGLFLGVIGLFQAAMLGEGLKFALVIGLTLPIVVIWANTTATIVPIIAHKLGIDPTVVSAPMITTIVDATGLLLYLSLATLIL